MSSLIIGCAKKRVLVGGGGINLFFGKLNLGCVGVSKVDAAPAIKTS